MLVHGVTAALAVVATLVPMSVRWSIPDGYVIGVPRGAAYSEVAGHLYLFDGHQSTIHVFDVDTGAPLFELGRAGEGPGDVAGNVRHVAVLDDGTVGVASTRGGLDLFDRDGLFLRKLIPSDDGRIVAGFRTAGEHLVVYQTYSEPLSSASEPIRSTTLLTRWHTADSWGPQLHEETFAYRRGPNALREGETFFLRGYDVGRDGTAYLARSWDYVVEVIAPDGSLKVWADRVTPRVTRTDEDLSELAARMNQKSACPTCPGFAWEFEAQHPAIRDLRVGDDGSLWVLPWSGVVEGNGQTWDLWSEGVRTHRVRYGFEINYRLDHAFWLSDELVLLVTNMNERETAAPVGIVLLGPEQE